jgi:hypothetical protein
MKFEHTVVLKPIHKDQYDREKPATKKLEWMFDNIGYPVLLPEDNGVWNTTHTYSGQDIIQEYSFKNPEDAILFSLRWA